jgi:hypothetical protein
MRSDALKRPMSVSFLACTAVLFTVAGCGTNEMQQSECLAGNDGLATHQMRRTAHAKE